MAPLVSGLRVAALLSMGIQVVAVSIQLLPVEPALRTVLITIGEFLVSFAVPPVQNVGALVVSANWFPPHERMTATAIATLASYLGSAASYVVGPNIVPDVEYGNITYQTGRGIDIDKLRKNVSEKHLRLMRNKIDQYIMLEAVIVSLLFFAVLVYFPAKPPKPPSRSSAAGRLDFTAGVKLLVTNRHFWLLLVVFSVSNGVSWGWSSVQDLIFSGVGISQKTAGWLGFWANVASLLGIAFSWWVRVPVSPVLISANVLACEASISRWQRVFADCWKRANCAGPNWRAVKIRKLSECSYLSTWNACFEG